MSKYLDAFLEALHARQKVKVIVKRKGKPTPLLATCAPLDYGARESASNDEAACFHFYKYPYQQHAGHIMLVEPENLTRLEILPEPFDPAEFITWDVTQKRWQVARDWGEFS
jgi:hypothetical protein